MLIAPALYIPMRERRRMFRSPRSSCDLGGYRALPGAELLLGQLEVAEEGGAIGRVLARGDGDDERFDAVELYCNHRDRLGPEGQPAPPLGTVWRVSHVLSSRFGWGHPLVGGLDS